MRSHRTCEQRILDLGTVCTYETIYEVCTYSTTLPLLIFFFLRKTKKLNNKRKQYETKHLKSLTK
jgi:hypothetical protein